MSAVAAFEGERPRLAGLAYRMLGSAMEAEDVVQDAFLRWQRQDAVAIRSARAFLTTTVTRLCIDRLRRVQREREEYAGPWLPEPVVELSPESIQERDETMSLAMLRMLERLSPNERAVFVLREAFDMDYAEIATAVGAPAATCRQWYKRARGHLAGEPRFDLSTQAQLDMLQALQQALASGDVAAVVALFDPRAEMRGDGGGKVTAFVRAVTGAERIATVLLHIARTTPRDVRLIRVNGGIGIAQFLGDELDAITTLEAIDGRILFFDIVRNPDKLARVAEQLGVPLAHAVGI